MKILAKFFVNENGYLISKNYFIEKKLFVIPRLPQKLQNQIPRIFRFFLGHFLGLFKIFSTGLKI